MKSKRFVLPIILLFFIFLYSTSTISGISPVPPPTSDTSSDSHLISPSEAWTLIQKNKNNPDFVILDVRTPKEFFGGRIQGSRNIDYYAPTFRKNLSNLDKSKTYLVYCRSGIRSQAAVTLMTQMGFKKLYDLKGGFLNWKKQNFPVLKGAN